MHVIFLLHQDGDCYLKYLVDKIFVEEKTIEEYCELYKDHPVLYQNKAYLNGEVISEDHQLTNFCPKIIISSKTVDKVKAIKDLEWRLESYSDNNNDDDESQIYQVDVYGNAYYVCETDGTKFDINNMIDGYGSF